MKIFMIIYLCLFGTIAVANEPLWTEGQREEKRDVVIEGEVLSVQMQHKIDEHESLYVAEIKIGKRHKGADGLPDKVKIYFEFSNTGKNVRHPQYAELNKDTKVKFFLLKCSADCKKKIKMEKQSGIVLFIEMGSDTIKNSEQRAQLDAAEAAPARLTLGIF